METLVLSNLLYDFRYGVWGQNQYDHALESSITH
jgi:hypothetical protein